MYAPLWPCKWAVASTLHSRHAVMSDIRYYVNQIPRTVETQLHDIAAHLKVEGNIVLRLTIIAHLNHVCLGSPAAPIAGEIDRLDVQIDLDAHAPINHQTPELGSEGHAG